ARSACGSSAQRPSRPRVPGPGRGLSSWKAPWRGHSNAWTPLFLNPARPPGVLEPVRRTGKDCTMEFLLRDVRFGARQLIKDKGFTLTALATLAICIGANAAVYTVVDAIVLRPLPV